MNSVYGVFEYRDLLCLFERRKDADDYAEFLKQQASPYEVVELNVTPELMEPLVR